MKRIFIVSPYHSDDTLWQVCTTNSSHKSLNEIYACDEFEEISSFSHEDYETGKQWAINTAKKHGSKRPTIV